MKWVNISHWFTHESSSCSPVSLSLSATELIDKFSNKALAINTIAPTKKKLITVKKKTYMEENSGKSQVHYDIYKKRQSICSIELLFLTKTTIMHRLCSLVLRSKQFPLNQWTLNFCTIMFLSVLTKSRKLDAQSLFQCQMHEMCCLCVHRQKPWHSFINVTNEDLDDFMHHFNSITYSLDTLETECRFCTL